ncbi:protein kinase [Achlya hypogyna]|uniref:Protein kinase n=1 Tax=Achlya hypogyna TaxID=1202772 RepID=A0A1V9YJT5_ACHHY|nr:protein kinase [Achlya hypogyna]
MVHGITVILCSFCKASHSMTAKTCPECNERTPSSAVKLKGLLQRVAIAKMRGLEIETKMICHVCNTVNDIKTTVCAGCKNSEWTDDDDKLWLLVKVVERAATRRLTMEQAGETPLHVAVRCNQQQVLKLLLQANGVDSTALDKNGNTPLVAAIKQGHRRFAQIIYKASTQLSREARMRVAATAIAIDYSDDLRQDSYYILYKGTFDKKPVAVKVAQIQSGDLNHEVKLMQRCKSPYLLHLVAFSGLNTRRPQLALEYMDGGNLREYLDKKRDGIAVAVEYSALEVACVVVNALADLHHNGVLHRDLKSHNVLLSSTKYIKVANLGLARKYARTMTFHTGTPYWMAPEMLKGEGSYDYAVDIYSFGVILTELSTLQRPYAGLSLNPSKIMSGVAAGNLRPVVDDTSPQWLRQLATDCLAHNPIQRPSAEAIIALLDRQRNLEATTLEPMTVNSLDRSLRSRLSQMSPLVSTEIQCPVCGASCAIVAAACPECGEAAMQTRTKLKVLLQRIVRANDSGMEIDTTLPCIACDSANDITSSMCNMCEEELPDDADKLRQLAGDTPLHVAVRCNHPQVLELLLYTNGVDSTALDKVPIAACHRRFAQIIYEASTQASREARMRVWPLHPQCAKVVTTSIAIDHKIVLGRGAFGVVYKGIFENQPVAVKTALPLAVAVAALKSEKNAMQLCKSPYLLHLVAFSDINTPQPQLVLEYMDGDNLREYLDKKRDGIAVAVEYSALEVAWVVANALADLHHNEVLHRDLKSHNVLLSSTNYIKVADLGLARTFASQMSLGIGTLLWTAPEVLRYEGSYDYAADIYSFGVILTELGTLKMPFQGLNMQHFQVLFDVREGKLHPDVGDTSPKWLRELATDCMSFDPVQRPSALKIIDRLEHQRRLEASALSTEMACFMCKTSHSMANAKCPHCTKPMLTPVTKLKCLLERVAVAKERGIEIDTTLLCGACDSTIDISATKCNACGAGEMPSDTATTSAYLLRESSGPGKRLSPAS